MNYPANLFHINEDITASNIKAYDARRETLRQKCLEINPNYYHLGLRERMNIRTQAIQALGWK